MRKHYSAASLMLRAYFLLEVLDILFRYMASSILANTDIKKSKPIGFCLIQNKHQNQHKKMGHFKMKLLLWLAQSLT